MVGRKRCSASLKAQERGRFFLYVRIPGDIQPTERGERFEDPLQAALDTEDLGEVTRGGSQIGEGKAVEFCGLDVEVTDRDRGLEVIRRLGVPRGTVIEGIFRAIVSCHLMRRQSDQSLQLTADRRDD